MDGRFYEVDAALHQLRERETRLPKALVEEFCGWMEISAIYHDSALEGVVLSYSEIKAAIDTKIISDVSLIPSYEEIKHYKTATAFVREYAANKKKPINLETIRKIYGILSPEEIAKGLPVRKENPLHRLYYHEISQPAQILPKLKKLGEWFEEDATKRMHPVERATRAHFKLMAIYPWTKNSGRVARLLSNLMLEREGFPPAIVHSIDRQRYYESLKGEPSLLLSLYLEAVQNTAENELRLYEEAEKAPPRKRKRA
jgi:Fic family protein